VDLGAPAPLDEGIAPIAHKQEALQALRERSSWATPP
jgi:hypothetical protein